jgi:hypothetical protein
MRTVLLVLLALLGTPFVGAAHAGPKAFVSGKGNVGAPCTRAQPCAVFQEAHDAVDAFGEINCIDAGEFSIVTITKSVTIDCTGFSAGITLNGSGNSAVTINTAGVVVTLRGLQITGTGFGPAGGGNIGVLFEAGAELHIENCTITAFRFAQGIGVHFRPSGNTAALYISDSTISDNGLPASGGGIIVQPGGLSSTRVTLDRVQVDNNTYGIFVNGTFPQGPITVQVRDSTSIGNKFDGISAFSAPNGAPTQVNVEHSASLLNGGNGIAAQGKGFVLLADSTVSSNGVGLSTVNGGTIYSYQNNQLKGNVTDVAPTAALSVK